MAFYFLLCSSVVEKVVFKVMNNIQPAQQAVDQPKNQQQERDFQLSHF